MASITVLIEDDRGNRVEYRSEFDDQGLLENKAWTRTEIQKVANGAKAYFDSEEVPD